MRFLPKLLLGLFLFLFLAFTFLLTAQAQIPPGKIPCDSDNNPEFHSLRPYQANPCNDAVEDVALFCGNDLVVIESVTVNKSQAASCITEGGKEVCEFKGIPGGGPIAVDLSGATLPIAGNTELVPNSQTSLSELGGNYLDNADKLNNYVNWYLQGAAYKAEEPLGDPYTLLAEHILVNYAGPIRKLLPQSKTFEKQSEIVEGAGNSQHNQIVACEAGPFPGPLAGLGFSWARIIDNPIVDLFALFFAPEWLQDALTWRVLPRLQVSATAGCYAGNNTGARNEWRLSDWDGVFLTRSIIDTILRIATSIGGALAEFVTGLDLDDAEKYVQSNISTAWSSRLPPIEGDPQFKGSRLSYLKAYYEWRGRRCAVIPLPLVDTIALGQELNFLFCSPDITASDDIANLFPYIPLSSNEDRKGEVEINTYSVYPASADLTIYDVALTDQEPADLFFPHMQAINEHADILQSLFAPSGAAKTQAAAKSAGVEPYCDILNVRSNPGDDLFAGEITANLSFKADFTCEFSPPGEGSGTPCPDQVNLAQCPSGEVCRNNRCILPPQNPSCTKNVAVNLSTVTKTPLIEDIWQKLVDGPSSVFKRIFPKVGTGGAIEGVLDIPASTKVVYSGANVKAGSPSNDRPGDKAELYFPHLGGVQEYFLKGIQTILRPKGFGEQILSGQSGTLPTPPPLGEIDCNQNAPEANVAGIISKADFVALAKRLIPQAAATTNAEFCYNDVIAKARASGVSPAYALVTWLLESNASNYAVSVEDFGVHRADVRGFTAQITRFFSTVSGFYSSCASESFWQDTMEATLYMYRTGDCFKNGNTEGKEYYDAVKNFFWPAVAPGCAFPSSPTQNTCN